LNIAFSGSSNDLMSVKLRPRKMKSRHHPIVAATFVALCLTRVLAADSPPPFDPRLPGAPAPVVPQVRPPVPGPIAAPLLGQMPPNNGVLPAGVLAFDSESKEYTTKPGEIMASFVFNLTNVSPNEVTVTHVQTSCGCTTAQLPPMPWKIPAGGSGQIPVNMNVLGKSGVVFKSVTLHTDKGQKPLMVKTTIVPPEPQPMNAADREKNQLLAKADRQAIFRGDCARCHVEPVIGKVGKDLYTTACGVCHEAEHRATMVPDLRNLPNDTSADYWKLMITLGKPNTLMAAFAQSQGGPLSDPQINSLVDYLTATMPAQGTNSRALLHKPKN
jgi:mono/diheme cytochrome c family protein